MTGGDINFEQAGRGMHLLASELFPLCRSITGDGVRRTLDIIKSHIPIEKREVATGTQVFDWTVPREWNIKSAWIKDPDGKNVVDFSDHNLHIVNYSIPVHQKFSLNELREHLHSLPQQPDLIPYRTTYYKEDWGFCISHQRLQQLKDGDYEVFIDSSLEDGSLTYGELVLPGEADDEFLISCHICHPSLANDNLSGMALATYLARYLQSRKNRLTYRFLFIPGTIGAITWLARNESIVPRIKHGLVVACVGDQGQMTYKKSRLGEAEIDRAVALVLGQSGQPHEIVDFSPYGYDERQYCSPGFNLPVGCLSRTPHGRYPEYHTSADNLELIRPEYLADSIKNYLAVIDLIENNRKYQNTNPKCEPQLGRRGLYRAMGGYSESNKLESALFWVLNFSDGNHDLLDIAVKSKLPFDSINKAASLLSEHGLLRESGE